MRAVAASVCAGLAAWCSLGTIGLIGAGTIETRVGLLPPFWLLPLLVAAVFAATRLARLSPSEISPLFGSAVVLLPWIVFPVPPAALIWTGPFVVTVWVVVIAGVVLTRWPDVRSPWLTSPRRAAIVAAAVALAFYGASAWWLRPILPDGDSPHYLILAQSLIRDGDVQIENNHHRGDYLEYSLLASQPHYLRRGVNGAIYSIHAPGLPAVIAPVMWLFGYPGAVAFLGIVAALSTALVWRLSYLVTASASAAWFAWACGALITPFFFQATQVFPDGFAATCVLLGALPLILAERGAARGREHDPATGPGLAIWWLSGASLAVLPWLQTRLTVVAAASAVCLCLRMRSVRQFVAFAALPTASAAAWFAFYYIVYGTPDPTAPYGPYTQATLANLRVGFPGILFDQQFGLIANAPVYGFVLAGVVVAAVRLRRWAWELLVVVIPYAIGAATYQIWWGGTSAPVRLLAPITLVLAIGAARVWHDARTAATRAMYFVALAVSVVIAASLLIPDHGRLLFNFRDGVALWVEWGNDLLDLSRGLPSVFRDNPAAALGKAAIWAASAIAGWIALQALERFSSGRRVRRLPPPLEASADTHRPGGERQGHHAGPGAPFLSWPAIWCLSAVPMIAFTLVWRISAVPPLTPARSEVGLLRHASALRPTAWDFGARHFEPSVDALSRTRVRSGGERPRVSPAQLLSALRVPAGAYSLHVASTGTAEGALTLRIGETTLPFLTVAASQVQLHPADVTVRLPVEVRSVIVEGDAAAVRSLSSVELEPLRSDAFTTVPTSGPAHRAVRYASGETFFLDENAYPEPTGFWVAGGRIAQTVIGSDGQAIELFLRNAPVDNTVIIDIDGEQQEIALAPGEERVMTLTRRRPGPYASIRITARSGFRPSEQEAGNQDFRYLGCWVEIRSRNQVRSQD